MTLELAESLPCRHAVDWSTRFEYGHWMLSTPKSLPVPNGDDNAGSMVDAARPLIVALEHSWTLCEASWRRQCRFHGRAVDDAQMSKNVEAGI